MPYYIRYQGRKQGPLSEPQLVTLLTRGTVTKETETSVNEVDWKPLGDFPEFERFYSQIITQQLKQESAPVAPPPSIGTYDLQTPENDIFALAGFSPEESNKKLDDIVKQMAAEAKAKAATEAAQQVLRKPVEKNPSLLYAIVGGATVVLLLVVVATIFFSGSGRPVARQQAAVQEEAQQAAVQEEASEETMSSPFDAVGQSVADLVAETVTPEPIVPPVAEVQAEPEEKEVETTAMTAATAMTEATMEVEQVAEEVKAAVAEADDKPTPHRTSVEWNEIVSPVKPVFPVKMLSLDAFGAVALSSCVSADFAALYPERERIRFKYVSYVPGKVFTSDNSAGHDLRVSHDGNGILRLSLEEDGLKAEWLDSPGLTPASYKMFNGAVLAELEVLRADTGRPLKTVSLFPPIQKTDRFSMSSRQVVLDQLDIDLDVLKLNEDSLQVAGIKNLYKGGRRETISEDAIRYFFLDDKKEYKVDIRAVAQTPTRTKEGVWRIPIYPDAEFPPSKEDMDMIAKIRSFIGGNIDRARSLSSENVRRKGRAIEIADEIGASARVTVSVLNDFDRELLVRKSVLSRKNAAAYKRFLEVVQNYRERLDKARRITMSESICFDILLVHPENEKKTIVFAEVGNKER